jgi:NADH:ubiquinone reductase (H+-translocating)
MRSASHRNLWARGDCAAMPGPDGRPYPALAQHAIREARTLARNIAAVIDGRSSAAFFFYRSLGTMASLGHSQAVAQVLGVRLSGFVAWWLRRTYYLLQMPRWDRRLRIILDWTIALFFRPDITKVDVAQHALPGAPDIRKTGCSYRSSQLWSRSRCRSGSQGLVGD